MTQMQRSCEQCHSTFVLASGLTGSGSLVIISDLTLFSKPAFRHLQALDARKSAKMARCYFDWDDMLKNNKDGQVSAAACPFLPSSGLHRMRLHLRCIPGALHSSGAGDRSSLQPVSLL